MYRSLLILLSPIEIPEPHEQVTARAMLDYLVKSYADSEQLYME